MNFFLKIKNKKIANTTYRDVIGSLEDGEYLVTVKKRRDDKNEESYRNQYFAMIDECVHITGYKKQEIHELYKEHRTIKTTENFTPLEWEDFIEKFKYYAYNNMGVVC